MPLSGFQLSISWRRYTQISWPSCAPVSRRSCGGITRSSVTFTIAKWTVPLVRCMRGIGYKTRGRVKPAFYGGVVVARSQTRDEVTVWFLCAVQCCRRVRFVFDGKWWIFITFLRIFEPWSRNLRMLMRREFCRFFLRVYHDRYDFLVLFCYLETHSAPPSALKC